jgi:hypothetical protein
MVKPDMDFQASPDRQRITRGFKVVLLFLLLATLGVAGVHGGNRTVNVPAEISHSDFDHLLSKYVNNWGLVDYGKWKNDAADLDALAEYIEHFASSDRPFAKGPEAVASLINLYNALTLQSILDAYPVESIREIKGVWTRRRFTVGGEPVSIDDVEHGTLRNLIGWKVHAVVVCAARSCPPLKPFAYDAATLDETLDAVNRAWLQRIDLNRFSASEKVAEISKIFDWYGEDFESVGGVREFLKDYAPERHQEFLSEGDAKITYLPYHWGLNDQSGLGKNYRGGLF